MRELKITKGYDRNNKKSKIVMVEFFGHTTYIFNDGSASQDKNTNYTHWKDNFIPENKQTNQAKNNEIDCNLCIWKDSYERQLNHTLALTKDAILRSVELIALKGEREA